MDPIDVTEGDREPSAADEGETSSVLRRSLWRMASVARKKRTYSMAPCGHNFVSSLYAPGSKTLLNNSITAHRLS